MRRDLSGADTRLDSHFFLDFSIASPFLSMQEETKRVQKKGYEALPQPSLSILQVIYLITSPKIMIISTGVVLSHIHDHHLDHLDLDNDNLQHWWGAASFRWSPSPTCLTLW